MNSLVISGTLIRRALIIAFVLSLLPGGVTQFAVGDRTPNILYADVFLLFMTFVFLLYLVKNKSILVNGDRPVLILFVLLILFQLLSLLFNDSDLFKGLLSLKISLTGALVYFIVLSMCKTERDTDWITYSLVLLTTSMSVILIIKYVVGFNYGDAFTKEMIGIGMGSSNYLAAFTAFFIPVCFGLVFSERRYLSRFIFLMAALVMIFSLAITMSNGAILSLLIAMGLVLPLLLKMKIKVLYILFLTTVLLIMYFVIPVAVPEPLLEKNVDLLEYRLDNFDPSRMRTMKTAWADFLDNPMLGIGPYQSYADNSTYENMPHNFVLQSFGDLGVLGGFSFLALLSIFIVRSLKNCFYGGPNSKWRIENVFFFAGIISTLIHGLIEITFQGPQYTIAFWTFMAAIYLKYRLPLRQEQSSKSKSGVYAGRASNNALPVNRQLLPGSYGDLV